MVVLNTELGVYRFSHDAFDYMKGIIDIYKEMAHTWFYSDDAIQFDWIFQSFWETNNTRYVSRGLVDEYARRQGEK